VRTAALLRVESPIRLNVSGGSVPNARSIAASSPEYRFCSDIGPRVEEKVPSFGLPYADGGSVTAPPTPTSPFRAELLVAMRMSQSASRCVAVTSFVIVGIRFSHGASVNGLMVSNPSIGMPLSASATW